MSDNLKAWVHWVKKNPIDEHQMQHALDTEKLFARIEELEQALTTIRDGLRSVTTRQPLFQIADKALRGEK